MWKSCCDCSGNSHQSIHKRRSRGGVELANVWDVVARYYQRVAWVKLPKIDKSHRKLILVYNTRRHLARYNIAECALHG